MSKALRLATTFALIALLATACGGATADDKPKKGGELNIGLVRPGSLDPALASTVSERVLADMLYDGLTKWDPKTLVPVPDLAERWTSSADQKHWTFRLKQDLIAANEEKITAADVRGTLERIVKNPASPVRELLSSVEGYSALAQGQATNLSGVAIVDDSTIRIDLTSPDAELPRLLGNPAFGIVHLIPNNDYITTGPFYLVQDKEAGTVLIKSPKSAANLDRINVELFNDVTAAYNGIEQHELDWVPIAPDNSRTAGDKYGTELFRPSLRALYLTFNLADPRFADQRFREAIMHAIDRKTLAKSISESSPALNAIVVEGVPGFNGDTCGVTCSYNTTTAKALIKDVFGGGKPPVVTIDISSGPPFTNAAVTSVVRDLQVAGIEVQVRPTPANAFGAITVQADRQLFQTSWSAAYPSPQAFLAPLFLAGAPSNVSGLNNAKVNETIVGAQSESNTAKRQTDWQAVERSILGMVPVIPIAQFPANSVQTSDRVHGISVLPTGNFDASQVWVS